MGNAGWAGFAHVATAFAKVDLSDLPSTLETSERVIVWLHKAVSTELPVAAAS